MDDDTTSPARTDTKCQASPRIGKSHSNHGVCHAHPRSHAHPRPHGRRLITICGRPHQQLKQWPAIRCRRISIRTCFLLLCALAAAAVMGMLLAASTSRPTQLRRHALTSTLTSPPRAAWRAAPAGRVPCQQKKRALGSPFRPDPPIRRSAVPRATCATCCVLLKNLPRCVCSPRCHASSMYGAAGETTHWAIIFMGEKRIWQSLGSDRARDQGSSLFALELASVCY